jgi:hypothetical protein
MIRPLSRLLPLLLAIACAGTAARQRSMLPALAETWTNGIRAQVVREAAAAGSSVAEIAVADAAFPTGDPVRIGSVDWALLDSYAAADIERQLAAQAIGPMVAESLRGRLADFIASRRLYLRQP